ncbi:MAG: M48 family metalloprotease [Burkholderiaceae bacterium]
MHARRISPVDSHGLGERLRRGRLTRRDLLWLLGASSSAAAIASLQGCAVSPVSGEQILVGLTEDEERNIDQELAPHQFSQDLGAVQDPGLNTYLSSVGESIAARSHRPKMPYSYRVLNANYVNAYTFPGGSMGVTRAIMTDMESEAELAALLGHETGHVNARHAAQRHGQAMVAQVAVVGLTAASTASDSPWAGLVGIVGQIGASALLSSYSRDNEREADALGQEYMVRAGYPANGMIELQQMLVSMHKREPGLLETMFATHPMPAERLRTAKELAQSRYGTSARRPIQRERYMDNTARLRALRPTIIDCQRGESALAAKKPGEGEKRLRQAVTRTPTDYASNLLLARCLVSMKRHDEARRFADRAQRIYPQEAQAARVGAVARMGLRDFDGAVQHLSRFERLLPGDPGVDFLMAAALEGSGKRPQAAQRYARFVRTVRQGPDAQHAMKRLKALGYAK